MKKCCKCKEVKSYDKFYKNKSRKDGLSNKCKNCDKKYKEKNKEKIKIQKREWRLKNKEKIKIQKREWDLKNKEKIKKYQKKRRGKRNEYHKQYREINKEKFKLIKKQSRKKNKDKERQYLKKRKETDAIFKLSGNIRTIIWKSMNRKGYSKKTKTYNILGIGYDDFLCWLNTYASNGLNFEKNNVHLDHVIPKCYARTAKELIALNHYSNLQLLTAEDNMKKGDAEPKFQNLKRVFDLHPDKDILHSILFE